MSVVSIVAYCLIILAFLGLIIVGVALAVVILQLKHGATRNAKRLYERPMQCFKNLVAAGNGVVQQESARFGAIASNFQRASNAATAAAEEVGAAVETMRDVDWQPAMAAVQTGLRFAAVAASVARSASKQGPA